MVVGARSLTFNDFKPVNDWVEERESGEVYDNGCPMYIIDQSTGKHYLNSSEKGIRFNCIVLSLLGVPICHTISMVGHTAYRIGKIVTGAHFWITKENERDYSLKERGLEAMEDLVKIVSAPFVLCALEASAIYGLFRPFDGRKLYASFERFAFYDRFFLAPCFQPDPSCHFFGGNLRTRDAL